MLKFFKTHFYLFIIPTCLIIGMIRKSQLDTSERLRFGYVHSSGTHTLIAFISIGVYLTVLYLIYKQLHESRYTKDVKIKVGMFIGMVSACILFIITSLIR